MTNTKAPTQKSSTEIRIAQTTAEKEAIYKLRYEVYVDEMHRAQPFADHAARRIEEPADRTAILLGAWEGGELVGTIRINVSRDTDFEYPEIYNFEEFEELFPGHVALITKLMIRKDRRGGRTCLNIFHETYKVLRTEGVCALIIDANDHLLGIYKRLGFRQTKEKVIHPLYGMVTPMHMMTKDEAYYAEVESPLTELCHFYNGMERLESSREFGYQSAIAA